jgi:Asp-tRNA(Asn)/Glu-tRNA(Gln) amidotransferase A subunit family amidase
MSRDLCFSTATELARRIRAREVSVTEVVQAHLAQIDRINPKVNAVVTLTAERALAEAREKDAALARGETAGPLFGLPVAHKDLVPTRGIRTTTSLTRTRSSSSACTRPAPLPLARPTRRSSGRARRRSTRSSGARSTHTT